MAEPRYRARDYCDRPADFGHAPDLLFVPRARADLSIRTAAASRRHLDSEVYAGSAQWQHEHVLAIRHILKVRKMSIGAYANRVGESHTRIKAMLGGTAVMRQDDVERADRVLGSVKLLVAVNARRRKLREIRAAIDEIRCDSEPPGPTDPMSQPLSSAGREGSNTGET